MRRLLARLSLLSLTNLVFVQAGSACPLNPSDEVSAGVTGGHEGHDMGATMNHEMYQSAPDESNSHGSSCAAMNACVVTLAVTSETLHAALPLHPVIGAEVQDRPASLTSVPELPPPRA